MLCCAMLCYAMLCYARVFLGGGGSDGEGVLVFRCAPLSSVLSVPVAPVAQRYHVTSDTLGREFDPGKRDFSH